MSRSALYFASNGVNMDGRNFSSENTNFMNTPSLTDRSDRQVAIWLLALCALVFAMVVLGGVTRLTGSGLSMADWRPVTGALPPLTEQAWDDTFALYQQTPEFQKRNSHMDVNDFKGIFWLEYLHRLLGRIIGIAFAVPFIVFFLRGTVVRREWPKYLLMFALGGMQGLLGWYMVKSGLVDNPHVSQYRLTAHLFAAFLIFAFMLWTALTLLYPKAEMRRHDWFGRTAVLATLLVVTIASGGFVAGLKAGKIYNTYPLMGDSLLPPGLFAMQPFWQNLFENAVTAQFNHRLLTLATLLAIVAYFFRSRTVPMPRRAVLARTAMLHTAGVQFLLGVATLLMSVPIALGAAHQAVAMILFGITLSLLHSLR